MIAVNHLLQAITVIGRLHQELDGLHGSKFLCGLQRASDLEQLPATRLQQLRAQLHHDLTTLDKVSRQYFYILNISVICHVLHFLVSFRC